MTPSQTSISKEEYRSQVIFLVEIIILPLTFFSGWSVTNHWHPYMINLSLSAILSLLGTLLRFFCINFKNSSASEKSGVMSCQFPNLFCNPQIFLFQTDYWILSFVRPFLFTPKFILWKLFNLALELWFVFRH